MCSFDNHSFPEHLVERVLLQKPSLLAVETQIAHSERKAEKAKSTGKTVEREVEEQEAELLRLKSDLENITRLANQAEGLYGFSCPSSSCLIALL